MGASLLATLMALDTNKGYRALRRGRHSQTGADYFVTFCTENRKSGLDVESIGLIIVTEIRKMETDGVWTVHCAVIMPDHLHLFVRLGEKLSLGRAIARLKAKSKGALKPLGLGWQDGYHEHRLRSDEAPMPIVLYIYLNPYRAKLLEPNARWPWLICGEESSHWFLPHLNNGLPEPAWLANIP